MGRRDPPTSQDGKTFLRNHAACVASIDHCFFKATAGAAIGDTSAGWQGSLTKRKCDGLTGTSAIRQTATPRRPSLLTSR